MPCREAGGFLVIGDQAFYSRKSTGTLQGGGGLASPPRRVGAPPRMRIGGSVLIWDCRSASSQKPWITLSSPGDAHAAGAEPPRAYQSSFLSELENLLLFPYGSIYRGRGQALSRLGVHDRISAPGWHPPFPGSPDELLNLNYAATPIRSGIPAAVAQPVRAAVS